MRARILPILIIILIITIILLLLLIIILLITIIILIIIILLIIMPGCSISIKIITSMATLLPTILTLNSNSYTGDRRRQPPSRSFDFGADDYKHWPPFVGHTELDRFSTHSESGLGKLTNNDQSGPDECGVVWETLF